MGPAHSSQPSETGADMSTEGGPVSVETWAEEIGLDVLELQPTELSRATPQSTHEQGQRVLASSHDSLIAWPSGFTLAGSQDSIKVSGEAKDAASPRAANSETAALHSGVSPLPSRLSAKSPVGSQQVRRPPTQEPAFQPSNLRLPAPPTGQSAPSVPIPKVVDPQSSHPTNPREVELDIQTKIAQIASLFSLRNRTLWTGCIAGSTMSFDMHDVAAFGCGQWLTDICIEITLAMVIRHHVNNTRAVVDFRTLDTLRRRFEAGQAQPTMPTHSVRTQTLTQYLSRDSIETLILPIYFPSHWVLCTASLRTRAICLHDPLQSHESLQRARYLVPALIRLLAESQVIQSKWRDVQWTVRAEVCRVQAPGDCGVEMVKNAFDLLNTNRVDLSPNPSGNELRLTFLKRIYDGIVEVPAPQPGREEGLSPLDPTEGFVEPDCVNMDDAPKTFGSLPHTSTGSVEWTRKAESKVPEESPVLQNEGSQDQRMLTSVPGEPSVEGDDVQPYRTNLHDMIYEIFLANQNQFLPCMEIVKRAHANYGPNPDYKRLKANIYRALKNGVRRYVRVSKCIPGTAFRATRPTPHYRLRNSEYAQMRIVRPATDFVKLQHIIIPIIRSSSLPNYYDFEVERLGLVTSSTGRADQLLKSYCLEKSIGGYVDYSQADNATVVMYKRWAPVQSSAIPLFTEMQEEQCQAAGALDRVHRKRGTQNGIKVTLLGNGVDGLTTENTTWTKLRKRWPGFNFEVVLLVPAEFGFKDVFGLHGSLRYCTFQCTVLEEAYNYWLSHRSELQPDIINDTSIPPAQKFIVMLYVGNRVKMNALDKRTTGHFIDVEAEVYRQTWQLLGMKRNTFVLNCKEE